MMWFVGHWVGVQLFKPWANGYFWGHLFTILVIIKLWIHFCNSSKFYQMTLLYIEETWYIWFMGFWAIFKGYFLFTNFFFQVDHENSSSLSKSLIRRKNLFHIDFHEVQALELVDRKHINIDMHVFVQDFFCKGHFPFPNCYYIL